MTIRPWRRTYLDAVSARSGRPGLGRRALWALIQGSTMPRYISAAEVDRVIASCDFTTPMRIRDRAVLLLLSRFGLRRQHFGLRLDDINWREEPCVFSAIRQRHQPSCAIGRSTRPPITRRLTSTCCPPFVDEIRALTRIP